MRFFDGATLVELLVVVTIIMILVSMLLSAIGGSRDEAQRVACRVAIRSYATRFSEQGRLIIEIPQEANCHQCHVPRYDAGSYLDTIGP